jgi:hypothetical protein
MILKNRLFLVVLVAFLAIGFGTVSAGTCPCSKPGTGVPSPVTTPSTLPTPLPTPTSSLPEFTITAIPDQNGVLAPAGLVKVAAGSSQQFFIIPLPGYKIDRVIVDGVNKGSVNMYTFDDVQADHALHAYFIEENQSSYAISLPLEPGWNFISTPNLSSRDLTRWIPYLAQRILQTIPCISMMRPQIIGLPLRDPQKLCRWMVSGFIQIRGI